MEYNERVKDIMSAVKDCPGTPDEKIAVCRYFAKSDLRNEALKTLHEQSNSKWFRDAVNSFKFEGKFKCIIRSNRYYYAVVN